MTARVLGMGWCTSAGMGRARQDAASFAMRRGPVAVPSRRDLYSEPDQRFGRLDDFSKVGLAALTMALRDAGLDAWDAKRSVGIVAASAFGSLATDASYMSTVLETNPGMEHGVSLASPHLFAFTLPNVFLGEAAIRFGLTGPMFAVGAPGGDDLTGVRQGMDLLADHECDLLLAGCCDLPAPTSLDCPALPEPLPGAVFLALAAEGRPAPAACPEPLAALDLDGERQILCNGLPARCMETLARLCLNPA